MSGYQVRVEPLCGIFVPENESCWTLIVLFGAALLNRPKSSLNSARLRFFCNVADAQCSWWLVFN